MHEKARLQIYSVFVSIVVSIPAYPSRGRPWFDSPTGSSFKYFSLRATKFSHPSTLIFESCWSLWIKCCSWFFWIKFPWSWWMKPEQWTWLYLFVEAIWDCISATSNFTLAQSATRNKNQITIDWKRQESSRTVGWVWKTVNCWKKNVSSLSRYLRNGS